MKTITVSAGIITKENKILLAKRKKKDKYGSFWEFPGGKLEANETLEKCLERELKEELNITAKTGKKLGVFNYFYKESNTEIILHVYFIEKYRGEIKLNEHQEIKWLSLEEIEKHNLLPADKNILLELKKELKFKN